ncbi:MAG: hypothetical protein AAB339_09975, partial [Elusimicrobiota bacterium]
HSTFSGGSAQFAGGTALVSLNVSSIPYLSVTTTPVNIFLSMDVSTLDGGSRPTLGDQVGFSLERFNDMIGPNGAELTATSHQSNETQIPARSGLVRISTTIIPLSTILPGVTIAGNGYPAMAKLDAEGKVVLSTETGRPVADESKWINEKGQKWTRTSAAAAAELKAENEPLLDVNGDEIPDNFDFLGTGKRQFVSLIGTDKPSLDLNGDGILDIDINSDGIPDRVTDDGKGNPIFFVVDRDGKAQPVSDQGLAMSAWNANSTEVRASWAKPTSTGAIAGYQLAVGKSFDEYSSFTFGWKTLGAVTSGTVTGLALPVPKVTRLSQPFGPTDTSIKVEDASNFFSQGKLVIGSEVLGAQRISNTEFRVLAGQAGCP